jgi:hypothetical protein
MAMSRPVAFGTSLAVFLLAAFTAASSQAQGRFSVSADGQEVLDSTTQLSWRRCAEGMRWDGTTCTGKMVKFTFGAAKKQAASTAKSDAKAWRVPSKDELAGLLDMKAKKKPRIDVLAFPKTPATLFWAARPGSDDDLNAWLVNFANGRVIGNVGQSKFPLRLVRDKT